MLFLMYEKIVFNTKAKTDQTSYLRIENSVFLATFFVLLSVIIFPSNHFSAILSCKFSFSINVSAVEVAQYVTIP